MSLSALSCEIVTAVIHDPTRVDPYYASAYRAFVDARRMLLKRPDRITNFYEDIQLVTDTHVDPRTIDVDPVDHVDPPMFFRRDVC